MNSSHRPMPHVVEAFIIAIYLAGSMFVPATAVAAIAGCGGAVAPQVVASGSASDLQFQITDNDPSQPIRWIEFDAPSGYFTAVNSVTAPGWTIGVDSNNIVTLTDGAVNPGDTLTVTINTQAFTGQSPPANWFTHVSDDPAGTRSILCDGDLNVQVISSATPPTITGISLSDLSPHSVTVSVRTDLPTTSGINYGTSGYDHALGDSTLSGLHTFVLPDLDANTQYHYQLTVDDGQGNVVTSADNTFLTPVEPPPFTAPPQIVGPPTIITVNVPGAVIKAIPTETVPPAVRIDSDLSRPFRQPPLISGQASDNEAVGRLDYSVDGGKNWLPVDNVDLSGRAVNASPKQVTFAFTPVMPDDGNYQLIVRAIDTSGNQASTAPKTLIIDRLPPQVGEVVTSFGPEVLTPGTSGATTLVAGADYHLTTSSIGGATSVTIQAHRPASAKVEASFALARSQDTGLWSGFMHFSLSGVFELQADSFDGAGNHTLRPLGSVLVLPAGRIVNQAARPVAGAMVTLYYREPSTKTWVVWDGAPYSQPNPQPAKQGSYSLMVPAGEYYLQATAPGYTTTLTQSFTVTSPTSLTADIPIASAPQLRLGSLHITLPSITLTQEPYSLHETHFQAAPSTLIGTHLPDFSLPTLAGSTKRAIDLNGRPTVLSLVNLWSPASTDQLAALSELESNPDIGVVPVFIQENTAFVNAALSTAGDHLSGLADPDGQLVNLAGIGAGPKHIFLDRSGQVKKVVVGVMSVAQLQTELSRL